MPSAMPRSSGSASISSRASRARRSSRTAATAARSAAVRAGQPDAVGCHPGMGAPGRPHGGEHDQDHYQQVRSRSEPRQAERGHAEHVNGEDSMRGEHEQRPADPLPGRAAQGDEGEHPSRSEHRPVHGPARTMSTAVPADGDDRSESDRHRDCRRWPVEAARARPRHQPQRGGEQSDPDRDGDRWLTIVVEVDNHLHQKRQLPDRATAATARGSSDSDAAATARGSSGPDAPPGSSAPDAPPASRGNSAPDAPPASRGNSGSDAAPISSARLTMARPGCRLRRRRLAGLHPPSRASAGLPPRPGRVATVSMPARPSRRRARRWIAAGQADPDRRWLDQSPGRYPGLSRTRRLASRPGRPVPPERPRPMPQRFRHGWPRSPGLHARRAPSPSPPPPAPALPPRPPLWPARRP